MRVNAMTFGRLIKLLMEGTRSCRELAEETGLHVLTVYAYCKELHKQELIHIAAWELNDYGRSSIKIYMWGKGHDAKRAVVTSKQARERHRAKMAQHKALTDWVKAA